MADGVKSIREKIAYRKFYNEREILENVNNENALTHGDIIVELKEKSYDKFTDMAQHAYQVLKSAMNMRDDLNVVVSTHSENMGDRMTPYYKMKTLGKMLDSVITLEGLFTYVFFTTIQRDDDNKPSYKFITNSDGTCTAKSPMGLFNDIYIDNDLDYVVKRIKEYNEED